MIIQEPSRLVSIHPGVVVLHLMMHGVLVFLWENPLLIIGQILFLLLWARQLKLLDPFPAILRYGWWISLAFLLVNPLMGQNGVTFLWKGPIVPVVGRMDLTVEELGYAVMAMLRLICLLLLSVMYQRGVDHDRFMLQFTKIAPKFVLTSLLAIRMVPFLSKELQRIQEIAQLRGLQPRTPSLRAKLIYQMSVFRPLLLSAMEGSWQTAESLYARGFGSGPRTIYRRERMNVQERVCLFLLLVFFLFIVAARVNGFGDFAFFPRVTWPDPLGDLLFLLILLVLWTLSAYGLTRRSEH
ncbi:MAG TPA: energy-coupling factor transporter transmembrane component T [Candidatus Bathyarchaeia archaeon]|nr:energy-coupling factor transporter transmembrane component T [Candidatus Bathyarchaeia archaeon]